MGERRRTKAGHDGLGAELRRLRGGRTLGQISALSKAEPLAGRIKPIAAPTLSLIENGISMPNLETLYTLSIIYRTPMQRLWEIVGLDRVIASVAVPDSLDATSERYNEALATSRWFEALALAAHGERLVDAQASPLGALRWREARAICLPHVGMHQEAILLLHDVLAHPALPADERYRVLKNLASAHLAAGQHVAAAIMGEHALDAMPPAVAPDESLALRSGLIAALCAEFEVLGREDERLGRRILRAVADARRHVSGASEQRRALLDFYEAHGRWATGNRLVAAKQLSELCTVARQQGNVAVELAATLHLGRLKHAQGDVRAAERLLAKAEELAFDQDDPAVIFEVALRQLELIGARDRAVREQARRRCERYHPLLQARTPAVLTYEALVEEASR